MTIDRERLDAWERCKPNKAAAARECGIPESTFKSWLREYQRKNGDIEAAREGYAPGHFESGVAPGYLMGKVTIQRGRDGDVERTWERQSPDDIAMRAAMEAAVAAMSAELPRVDPVPAPAASNANLATLYTLTDCHVGALCWHKEGGADWDLQIAENTLVGCFKAMVDAAPSSELGVVNQLGDFLHWDGLLAVTPTSGHHLDADGRFEKLVETAIRILRQVIDLALAKHNRVHVLMCEGNHDLASSVWLRKMFAALYENEPRVQVNDSALPYYCLQHGSTMLGFHHGHLKKNDSLPELFAAQFATVWGSTVKRYIHTGHRHHVEEREHAGVTVTQHPTLAARDAYAARGGWISERSASAITYHSRFGQVGRITVCPEMLEAA